MKKFLLMFLCSLLSYVVFSQRATIEEAAIIAKNVITERILPLANNGIIYNIRESFTEKYEKEEVFHVFNLTPAGFIIISIDKTTEPVLAFSYESEYNKVTLHPAAKLFIDSYSKQIDKSLKDKSPASKEIKDKWQHFLKSSSEFKAKEEITSVAPLLNTKWGQGLYYNDHCPEDSKGTNGHVVTGCVATALGQLLNYFRYPQQGIGSYGYEHPDYGWLEVDFSQQTYNYDKMPVKPNDENDEIAKLLYNIGISVDMEYGPSGSGMTNHKGAYTLHTYFGYNPETKYLFKDSLPEDFDWNGTLVDHLNRKIPLYYAGWGDYEYISGHAFIFDGYSDSTHYHINWGWSGSMDGYFLVDNLKPGGSDFTLVHEVIVNAVPNVILNSCDELKILNSYEGIIDDGSGPLNNYKAGLECSWLISPQDSLESISLEFLKFDLAESDYITIYDGNSENAPILTQIYGYEEPTTIISTANEVLIKFVTTSDDTNDGWLIAYNSNLHEYCALSVILRENSGIITDGSGTFPYQNNTNCSWRIMPNDMKNVQLIFRECDLESNDRIKIYNENEKLLYEFSDTTLNVPIIIECKRAKINFISNYNKRGAGFKLEYETNVENFIDTYESNNISLYPNPAKDFITIKFQDIIGITNIQIFDSYGKQCYENNIKASEDLEFKIDIANYVSGIYFIAIKNDNKIANLKFTKD